MGFQIDSESDMSESKSEREVQTTYKDEETSDENKEKNDNGLPDLASPLRCSLVPCEKFPDVSTRSTDDTKMLDLQLTTNEDKVQEHQTITGSLSLDPQQLLDTLKLCSFNWFQFVATLKRKFLDD